jgi:hypothetical protein
VGRVFAARRSGDAILTGTRGYLPIERRLETCAAGYSAAAKA